MFRLSLVFALVFVMIGGCASSGQQSHAKNEAPDTSTDRTSAEKERPELRKQLVEMRDRDQQMRQRLLREHGTIAPDKDEFSELAEMDRRHTEQLRKIVDELGRWPGEDLVGKQGADAAWMIAQHADHDVEFQSRILELLGDAVDADRAPRKHLAYLTDRIRLNRGDKQLYGTQAEISDGEVTLKPVEDRDNLDERRRKMGLPPLEVYLAQVKKLYEKIERE